MNNETPPMDADIQTLKNLTAIVYLCHVLTFFLAGLPLLIGAIINFIKRDQVKDTWLQSHFDWQIKSTCIFLGGTALFGLTFEFGVGVLIMIATVVLFIYRIVIGWNALNSDKPVSE